jgi:hypothetical protein
MLALARRGKHGIEVAASPTCSTTPRPGLRKAASEPASRRVSGIEITNAAPALRIAEKCDRAARARRSAWTATHSPDRTPS